MAMVLDTMTRSNFPQANTYLLLQAKGPRRYAALHVELYNLGNKVQLFAILYTAALDPNKSYFY